MVYADFVHLFGENINIITKNVEAIVVGLKVNTEKTWAYVHISSPEYKAEQ